MNERNDTVRKWKSKKIKIKQRKQERGTIGRREIKQEENGKAMRWQIDLKTDREKEKP